MLSMLLTSTPQAKVGQFEVLMSYEEFYLDRRYAYQH